MSVYDLRFPFMPIQNIRWTDFNKKTPPLKRIVLPRKYPAFFKILFTTITVTIKLVKIRSLNIDSFYNRSQSSTVI